MISYDDFFVSLNLISDDNTNSNFHHSLSCYDKNSALVKKKKKKNGTYHIYTHTKRNINESKFANTLAR